MTPIINYKNPPSEIQIVLSNKHGPYSKTNTSQDFEEEAKKETSLSFNHITKSSAFNIGSSYED